jgi:hypothetical protein
MPLITSIIVPIQLSKESCDSLCYPPLGQNLFHSLTNRWLAHLPPPGIWPADINFQASFHTLLLPQILKIPKTSKLSRRFPLGTKRDSSRSGSYPLFPVFPLPHSHGEAEIRQETDAGFLKSSSTMFLVVQGGCQPGQVPLKVLYYTSNFYPVSSDHVLSSPYPDVMAKSPSHGPMPCRPFLSRCSHEDVINLSHLAYFQQREPSDS